MSSGSSMQVTIGSALSRAWDLGQDVDILVDGLWLSGRIAALDGMGVALDGESFERYVVRLEHIAAIRIRAFATDAGLQARQPDALGISDVA